MTSAVTTTEASRETDKVFDIVHARLLRFFPELVEELGGEVAPLLRAAGIDPVDRPGSRPATTYRQTIQLMELAAAELACPEFGMRLAWMQHGAQVFGPLGLAMKNSRTFGDALEYVASHTYAHSLAARVWQRRWPDGGLFSHHDILLDRMPVKTQAVEQIMLLGHLAALEITGGHARARLVHFRHQPLSPPRTYRRYFGCEVRFGENEDGVLFAARDLACPILAPDAQEYRKVTAFIDRHFSRRRPPLHAQARGLVMQFLGTGLCTNERVAADLGLHPRTLHRRLAAEGTSFQQIKDEVRRDILLYYLGQTDLDFARISERLGFAEQSVMTRCCRRWFAASPSELRARGTLAAA
jgi:AraC-like DNA-binding protein